MSFENSQVKNINEYIINAISLNLKEIITENESQSKYAKKDIFYLSSLPSISLNDYIKRIMKYSKMDISSLINAIIYLDIFCNRNNYILEQIHSPLDCRLAITRLTLSLASVTGISLTKK